MATDDNNDFTKKQLTEITKVLLKASSYLKEAAKGQVVKNEKTGLHEDGEIIKQLMKMNKSIDLMADEQYSEEIEEIHRILSDREYAAAKGRAQEFEDFEFMWNEGMLGTDKEAALANQTQTILNQNDIKDPKEEQKRAISFSDRGLRQLSTVIENSIIAANTHSKEKQQYAKERGSNAADRDDPSILGAVFKRMLPFIVAVGAAAWSAWTYIKSLFDEQVGKWTLLISNIGISLLGVGKWLATRFENFGKYVYEIATDLLGFVFRPIVRMIKVVFPSIFTSGGLLEKVAEVAAKLITKVSRYLPVVGAALSLYLAYRRIEQGDFLGSLLEIASGIASLVPGIGTAVSIGLAIVMGITDFAGAEGDGKPKRTTYQVWTDFIAPVTNWIAEKIIRYGRYIPVVGGLFWLYDAYDQVSRGDYLMAITSLALGIASFVPGVGTMVAFGVSVLSGLLGANPSESDAQSDNEKFNLTDWIMKGGKKLFRTIMGALIPYSGWFGVASKLRKLLGLPASKEDELIEEAKDAEEERRKQAFKDSVKKMRERDEAREKAVNAAQDAATKAHIKSEEDKAKAIKDSAAKSNKALEDSAENFNKQIEASVAETEKVTAANVKTIEAKKAPDQNAIKEAKALSDNSEKNTKEVVKATDKVAEAVTNNGDRQVKATEKLIAAIQDMSVRLSNLENATNIVQNSNTSVINNNMSATSYKSQVRAMV